MFDTHKYPAPTARCCVSATGSSGLSVAAPATGPPGMTVVYSTAQNFGPAPSLSSAPGPATSIG